MEYKQQQDTQEQQGTQRYGYEKDSKHRRQTAHSSQITFLHVARNILTPTGLVVPCLYYFVQTSYQGTQ